MRSRRASVWRGAAIEAPDPEVVLGATLAQDQPQPHVRVLLDPAGHPFCLVRDDG